MKEKNKERKHKIKKKMIMKKKNFLEKEMNYEF